MNAILVAKKPNVNWYIWQNDCYDEIFLEMFISNIFLVDLFDVKSENHLPMQLDVIKPWVDAYLFEWNYEYWVNKLEKVGDCFP